MLNSARSALRPAIRATANARGYSTCRPVRRGALLAVSGLTIGLLASTPLLADTKPTKTKKSEFQDSYMAGPEAMKDTDVRTSVLDQSSLKENIHKRQSAADPGPQSDPTIEKKAEEASKPSEGAFNEETGEINWDCPCLGGMADGPCGEAFKAAFSCFVYSEQEPKGVDCVDKFKDMQDCFRAHPDVYGEELDDLDDEDVMPESEDPRPKKGPPATPVGPPVNAEGKKQAHR